VHAERDPPEREQAGEDQQDRPPPARAQPDGDRDRERACGVVARESGVGCVGEERMHAGMCDERARPVHQVADDRGDDQRARGGRDRRDGSRTHLHGGSTTTREEEQHEQRGEQELGRALIRDRHVLDAVVVDEHAVEKVDDRPVRQGSRRKHAVDRADASWGLCTVCVGLRLG
jgi:hypothetical protein